MEEEGVAVVEDRTRRSPGKIDLGSEMILLFELNYSLACSTGLRHC